MIVLIFVKSSVMTSLGVSKTKLIYYLCYCTHCNISSLDAMFPFIIFCMIKA